MPMQATAGVEPSAIGHFFEWKWTFLDQQMESDQIRSDRKRKQIHQLDTAKMDDFNCGAIKGKSGESEPFEI